MKATEIQKQKMKVYYQDNIEAFKKRKAQYYQDHKDKWKPRDEQHRQHLRNWAKNNNHKIRQEAINAYGGKCECCGENRYEFLAFDHIDGSGTQQRKQLGYRATSMHKWLRKNNYPKGTIRILCHNCNLVLGFYKYCPHNKKKDNP